MKAEARIKWWKLKKEECCTKFSKGLRQALRSREDISLGKVQQ